MAFCLSGVTGTDKRCWLTVLALTENQPDESETDESEAAESQAGEIRHHPSRP